jgi:hypothetical protein
LEECSSTQECDVVKDSITITIGNTTYTVEHVYDGSRSVHEVMADFLEREARNLKT